MNKGEQVLGEALDLAGELDENTDLEQDVELAAVCITAARLFCAGAGELTRAAQLSEQLVSWSQVETEQREAAQRAEAGPDDDDDDDDGTDEYDVADDEFRSSIRAGGGGRRSHASRGRGRRR